MSTSNQNNLALWLVNKKNWLTHFMIVAAISIAGLIYLGGATYMGAPPLVDYISSTGETVVSQAQIKQSTSQTLSLAQKRSLHSSARRTLM